MPGRFSVWLIYASTHTQAATIPCHPSGLTEGRTPGIRADAACHLNLHL